MYVWCMNGSAIKHSSVIKQSMSQMKIYLTYTLYKIYLSIYLSIMDDIFFSQTANYTPVAELFL